MDGPVDEYHSISNSKMHFRIHLIEQDQSWGSACENEMNLRTERLGISTNF